MEPYFRDDEADITLYCADCASVLPYLNEEAFILSDPPWGINYNTDSRRFTGGKGSHHCKREPIVGDMTSFDPTALLRFQYVTLWGANHFGEGLPKGSMLVWVKKSPGKLGKVLSDAELAWESGGEGVYVFWHVWDGVARESENGLHLYPSQKPVALARWCIARRNLKENVVLVDPYMGSGFVLVAAKEMGLPAIGIDIRREACEITKQRLMATPRSLFAEPPPMPEQGSLFS